MPDLCGSTCRKRAVCGNERVGCSISGYLNSVKDIYKMPIFAFSDKFNTK